MSEAPRRRRVEGVAAVALLGAGVLVVLAWVVGLAALVLVVAHGL